MMATFQEIISSARVLVSDAGSVRYSDAQMIEYANEAVAAAKKVRPDFFLGKYTTALPTYVAADAIPIPAEYKQSLVDYIVFRCESRDDEYTVDGRATAFFQTFRMGLVGK